MPLLLALALAVSTSHAGPFEDLGGRMKELGGAFEAFRHRAARRPRERAPLPANPTEERIAALAGVRCPCTVLETPLGQGSHGTTRLRIKGAAGEADLVLKRYPVDAMMKWKAAPIQHRPIPPVTHAHRQVPNEVEMTRRFRDAGLRAVEIVAFDPEVPWLVKRFVPGEPLSEAIARAYRRDPAALDVVRRFGRALALAHLHGLTVGDLTADNVIVAGGEPTFIDLDQAAAGVSIGPSWDVGYFLFDALNHVDAPGRGFPRSRAWLTFADAFLEGYRAAGGALDADKIFSLRMLAPEVFVTRPDRFPSVVAHLRRAVERANR